MARAAMRLEDLTDEADFCEGCGTRLPLDAYHGRRKYCSPECRTRHYTHLDSEGRRDANLGRKCEQCGLPLTRGRTEQARYCSRLCQQRAWYEPRHPASCRQCGTAFMAHRPSQKYCCHECSAKAALKPPRPCAWCGEPFRNKPRVKCCSPSCGARLRAKRQKGAFTSEAVANV